VSLRVTTSPRKWEQEGILRTVLLVWALRLLHFCGVNPARLHRWYYGRSLGTTLSLSGEEKAG